MKKDQPLQGDAGLLFKIIDMRPPRPRPALVIALGGACAAGLILASCRRPGSERVTRVAPAAPVPPALPPTPLVTVEQSGRFVGSEACAGCHPAECEAHSRSRHSRTLGPVAGASLAAFTRSDVLRDRALGAVYRVALRGGKPIFRAVQEDSGRAVEETPRLGVGSGRVGYTFLIERNGRFMESRLTYYPHRKWSWTPGQQQELPERVPLGRILDPDEALRCLLCHGTAVVREGERVRLDRSRLSIGCERCHGPGRDHVRAAGKGPIFRFRAVKGETVMALCAECHRGTMDVLKPEDLQSPQLARFQSAALPLSRCFKESGGRLTCVTCHSAHGPTDPRPARLEAPCKSCHTGSSGTRACPVNPRNGCVSCHMPLQSLGEPMQLAFHHHWIRVYNGQKGQPAPKAR